MAAPRKNAKKQAKAKVRTKVKELTPGHYKWLVNSRHRNMSGALRLYSLMVTHKARIGASSTLRPLSRMLISAAFSLWRSVFLARTSVAELETEAALHSSSFLKKMIEDNTISFVQDQRYNSFSFRYYAYAADMFLNEANTRIKGLAGEDVYVSSRKNSKKRWRDAQTRFDKAVESFENHLRNRRGVGRRTSRDQSGH